MSKATKRGPRKGVSRGPYKKRDGQENGIEKHSKKIEKGKATRQKTAEALEKALKGDLFEIEKNPPPPIRPTNEQVKAFWEKLERTVKQTPKGGAFVIPTATKGAAQRFLVTNYPNDKFRYFIIADNVEMTRVYKSKKVE